MCDSTIASTPRQQAMRVNSKMKRSYEQGTQALSAFAVRHFCFFGRVTFDSKRTAAGQRARENWGTCSSEPSKAGRASEGPGSGLETHAWRRTMLCARRTTHDARRTTHDARRTTHDARRTQCGECGIGGCEGRVRRSTNGGRSRERAYVRHGQDESRQAIALHDRPIKRRGLPTIERRAVACQSP